MTLTANETRAHSLYPDVDWDGSVYVSGYGPMVEAMGDVLLWVTTGSYQGDFHVLVRGPGGDFGYISIGYGSCAGCDALQGCNTAEQIGQLAESIQLGIYWEVDAAAMQKWLLERDWQVQWMYSDFDEFKEFLRKALKIVDTAADVIDGFIEGLEMDNDS